MTQTLQRTIHRTGYRTIYVEEKIKEHSRAQSILRRLSPCRIIYCDSYREVFNPRRQHFRLQKQNPALILAHKERGHLQSSPYGLGGAHNYYFSYMLNCIYDCSYCFLQGLYSSARYVIFINYEDFFSAIARKMEQLKNQQAFFFSGYDCDSLAYEPVSSFIANALPFFADHPQAVLELRTKSTQISGLLRREPLDNCIVAFSLSPQSIVSLYEHKTPSLQKRLDAMARLARQGWQLGIRLDPLMWEENWRDSYSELIEQLAAVVPISSLHSITLGTLRFPQPLYANMLRLYPTSSFLIKGMIVSDKQASLQRRLAREMTDFCRQSLAHHYDKTKIFSMTGDEP